MKLSGLLNLPVVEESGKARGHVFDVCAARRGNRYQVTALVVGKRGFLQRLGVRPSQLGVNDERDQIPWEQVLRMEKGRIVIKTGT